MYELFKEQLNRTQPLTEDVLVKLQQKKYFNGDNKQVGDVVLIAMLVGDIIEEEGEYPKLPLNLITLNEKHFDLFYCDNTPNTLIPNIKLKNIC